MSRGGSSENGFGGFKVIQKYVPKQFKEHDSSNQPDKDLQKLLFDYALLVIDTRGYDLVKCCGSLGYDFSWEHSRSYLEKMEKQKEIDLSLFSYLEVKTNKKQLIGFSGTAYCDKQYLIYTFHTKRGMSGAAVLGQSPRGYVIRGIHERDVSNMVQTKDAHLSRKGALKLSWPMFLDMSLNFRKKAVYHWYDLDEKGIDPKDVQEVAMEIISHQRELALLAQQKYLQKSLVILWMDRNYLGDEGCRILSKMKIANLFTLSLDGNQIGDEGCRYLAQGQWTRMYRLSLCFNLVGEKGCQYISQAQHWDNLRVIELLDNKVSKSEGSKYFQYLPWTINWRSS